MINNMTQDLGFASPGANRQEGPLRIVVCKYCGDQIVWATSARTGKRYPVSISHGYNGQRYYNKSRFHNCREVSK